MRNQHVALQFIGKEMVLAHGHRVESTPRAEFGQLFNFYLGNHTPERKDYLMDNGVADEGALTFVLFGSEQIEHQFIVDLEEQPGLEFPRGQL